MEKPRLLIVEDEPHLRSLYTRMLQLEGYEVLAVSALHEAYALLGQQQVPLVLSDVRLPDGSGVDAIAKYRQLAPQAEVILVTAFGQLQDGIRAIKAGAFDYLVKGESEAQLVPTLARALEVARQRARMVAAPPVAPTPAFEQLLGASPAFRAAVEQARLVAPTDTSVLLLGETGSGKEQFAHALHAASQRAQGPFVALNCAAIPMEMLESELFGYRKGAFTGAQQAKDGLLKAADGGTLLLDEIGEMPLDLQAKLLRVLDSGTYLRLGDTTPTQVNLRVVAATHRDLKHEAQRGTFRADLYYRLAVFTLVLPPLRDRREDILLLGLHYLKLYGQRLGKTFETIGLEAKAWLEGYNWPGNIRELRNVMERAAILAPGPELTTAHLPLDLAPAVPVAATAPSDDTSLAAAEAAHIRRVLAETGGNKTETARRLGIALTTLYRKLEAYGIEG